MRRLAIIDLAHHVGFTLDEIIEVEMVEPALPSGYPLSFAWVTPRASNAHVLATVTPCRHHSAPSSPDVSVTLFRAVHTGRVRIAARLARPWQRVKSGLRPFLARVTVAR